MPLSVPRLSSSLQKKFVDSILKRHSDAKPRNKYMRAFTKAIATGVVISLKKGVGRITPSGGLGSAGIGIKGISSQRIASEMAIRMKKQFGDSTPIGSDLTKAIGAAVVSECAKATVTGTAAGRAANFSGWTPAGMALQMQKTSGFKKNKYNTQFWKLVSEVVTSEIRRFGYSSIPRTGAGTGVPVAKIS